VNPDCSRKSLKEKSANLAASTVTPNPSIERTNNGGQQLAVLRALHAPLFAAHVER
jgi:hypothetical protein